jgi:hypothetical protein
MMEWQPINSAPMDREIFARDAEGNERWTRSEFGSWTYKGWRENADREEYESDEWWEPTEWQSAPNTTATT